jgi:hypothetical protein
MAVGRAVPAFAKSTKESSVYLGYVLLVYNVTKNSDCQIYSSLSFILVQYVDKFNPEKCMFSVFRLIFLGSK